MSGIGYKVSEAIARVHAAIDAEREEAERLAAERAAAVDASPLLRTLRDHAHECGLLLAIIRLRPGVHLDAILEFMRQGEPGSRRQGKGPAPDAIDRRLLQGLLDAMEEVGWIRASIDRSLSLGQLAYHER